MRYATSPSRRSRLAGCTFSSGIVNRPASITRVAIARSRYWHGRTPAPPDGISKFTAADARRRSDGSGLVRRPWQGVHMVLHTDPRLEGTFRVGTHRRISFAQYGDPHGRLVFWFHGTPGGRRQIAPQTDGIATDLGIRLIVLERPGVGF